MRFLRPEFYTCTRVEIDRHHYFGRTDGLSSEDCAVESFKCFEVFFSGSL